jgi:hypothetical protein
VSKNLPSEMNDENPFDKKGKEKERNGFLCVCYVKER